MPRQQLGNQLQRPLFQCFGQQCVVGVSKRAACYFPSLLPAHAVLVDQKTHQLGDTDSRVCIVQLNGKLFVKDFEALSALMENSDHVL